MESASGLPPFPKDVPTHPLLQISLKKLLDNNAEEEKRVIDACEDNGFFYLDVRDAGSYSSILSDIDKLLMIGEEFFSLNLEEKMKYNLSSTTPYFGYKRPGSSVIDRTGKRDRNESYNVSKVDMLGIVEPLPRPDPFKRGHETVVSFMKTSHSTVTLLLNLLNKSLDLPKGTLASLHQLKAMSSDTVRIIKAPSLPLDERDAIILREHTDYGSITLVYNTLGGLQALAPGKDAKFVYVQPLPGHLIVNIGDSLYRFTNGLLRASMHRVVAPPGEQADFDRYSLTYFLRLGWNESWGPEERHGLTFGR
ncbi:Clavaminate synthase-like protein [Hypoxylon sp. FL1857]|nr:Clavaminate synthase-like protein [Hypoxylon sp. FL1857]